MSFEHAMHVKIGHFLSTTSVTLVKEANTFTQAEVHAACWMAGLHITAHKLGAQQQHNLGIVIEGKHHCTLA